MSFLLTALIMFVFWIALSWQFTVIHLASGIVSSLLVAYLSHDIFIGRAKIRPGITRLGRFIRYLPWLFWQIAISNIDLVRRTLHPRMPINPRLVTFKNTCKTEIGMVILANSITLTPGTITIEVNRDEFIIHAISEYSAEGLLSGEMQERVKEIEGGHV